MKKLNMGLKVVVLPLIIFIAAFFFFMQGVGSLRAQDTEEPRKMGFYVGVSPYVMGATLTKEVKRAEVDRTTISNIEYDATFGLDLPEIFKQEKSAVYAIVELCKGNYELITDVPSSAGYSIGDAEIAEAGNNSRAIFNIQQFTVGIAGTNFNNFPDETGDISFATTAERIANASRCKNYFDSKSIENASTTPIAGSKTEETLIGSGINLGYNLEKWGFSFSHYDLSDGENKLQSQVLLADYLLPYGFSVGVGFASMQLDTPIGKQSKTAPAIHLGLFSSSLWKNLRFEAGYLLLLNAELLVQQQQQANQQAIRQEDFFVAMGVEEQNAAAAYLKKNPPTGERRFLVRQTQTGTRAQETKTTTEIRVKSPSAFYINFIWRFR